MTARNMTGARSLGEATGPRTQNVTTRSAPTTVTPPAGDDQGDPQTAELLALIAEDRIHAADRARIIGAMVAEATEHAGVVDPNRVRDRLTLNGALTVYPRVIGATYGALSSFGVLRHAGWTINRDRANAGKPCRVYRLDRAALAEYVHNGARRRSA